MQFYVKYVFQVLNFNAILITYNLNNIKGNVNSFAIYYELPVVMRKNKEIFYTTMVNCKEILKLLK